MTKKAESTTPGHLVLRDIEMETKEKCLLFFDQEELSSMLSEQKVPQKKQKPNRTMTPITFQDVVACFSEEEWKLLNEWQNELYRNLMNNINQALISLGPLIATSVFSLNAKEKKGPCHMENNCEIRQNLYCTPGHKTDSSDMFFQINQEVNQNIKCYEETDEVLAHDSLNTAFPVLTFDNVLRMEQELTASVSTHQDAYAEQNRINIPPSEHESILPIISFKIKDEEDNHSMDQQNSARIGKTNASEEHESILPIISFKIKDEEVNHSMDQQNSARTGQANGSKGHEAIQRKSHAKKPLIVTSSSKANVMGFLQPQNGTNSRSQPSVINNTHLGGQRTQPCKTVFRKETYSNFQTESPKAGIPYAFNECVSNARNVTLNISPQNECQNWRQNASTTGCGRNVPYKESFTQNSQLDTKGKRYTCSECGKSYTLMGNLIRHKTIHFGHKPYKCTICEKCFSQKVHFIRHQRMHSGERPYQCAECKKRFSRKESLLAHERTHTGDRPYQCSECEKSYSVKKSLIFHQRTHTGEKPYQCAVCDKRFSWKENLIVHQRTHITAQFEGSNTASI